MIDQVRSRVRVRVRVKATVTVGLALPLPLIVNLTQFNGKPMLWRFFGVWGDCARRNGVVMVNLDIGEI